MHACIRYEYVHAYVCVQLLLVSRRVCAGTAVGVAKTHAQEATKLLTDTFPNKQSLN